MPLALPAPPGATILFLLEKKRSSRGDVAGLGLATADDVIRADFTRAADLIKPPLASGSFLLELRLSRSGMVAF